MGGETSQEGGEARSKCVRACVVFSVYEINRGKKKKPPPKKEFGSRSRLRSRRENGNESEVSRNELNQS